MALSKSAGALACALGVIGGVAAIFTALGDVDIADGLFGSHTTQIVLFAVGAIALVAPVIAWYAHGPRPLSRAQQLDDLMHHPLNTAEPPIRL